MYKTVATDGFLKSLDKSKPSLFFDIDHTIIFPVGNKRFYSPKDSYKWVPQPNAKSTLRRAVSDGFTIYFITNQLQYNSEVEKRFYEMLRYLEIEALILIADQRNSYRKPSAKLIQDPNIPGGLPTIDKELSLYCGDAAGRLTDFSDDDIWFSRYAELNFYLPHEILNTSFDFTIRRKFCNKVARLPVDQTLIKTLRKFYEESDGLMLIGLPGSGKSTIRDWCLDNLKGRPIYVYNNDEKLSFPEKKDRKSPFYIFDNTNLTEIQRKKYSEGLNLKNVYLDIGAKESIRAVKYRNIFCGGIHIPDVVIHTMNSRKEIPLQIDLHLTHRPVLNEDYPPYLN